MTYTERRDDLHVISPRRATCQKLDVTSRKFPANPAEIEALIAAAPEHASDPEWVVGLTDWRPLWMPRYLRDRYPFPIGLSHLPGMSV
jgi:hypothetical protein